MFVPVGAPSFSRGAPLGRRDLPRARKVLHEQRPATAVGDEGGFAPDLAYNEDALELLMEAIERGRTLPGDEIAIALDPATTELYEDGHYVLARRGTTLTPGRVVDYWDELVDALPDRLDRGRDGGGGLGRLGAAHRALGERVQLVGDDMFVTNSERWTRASTTGVANSILIKLNQIGTLTETLDDHGARAAAPATARDLAPFGRDRGHVDRRPRSRDERGPDQDRRAGALGPGRQVQQPAPHRGRARRVRCLSRPCRLGRRYKERRLSELSRIERRRAVTRRRRA